MAQLLKSKVNNKKNFRIIVIALCMHFYTECVFAQKITKTASIDKNYIDFQLYGISIVEGDNVNQSTNSSEYRNLAYTFTNIDIDFNFNKNLAIATQTTLQNRFNGFGRTQATADYINATNQTSFLFQNTGATARVLALHLHNGNTSLLIGKIRPRSGVANGLNYEIIQQDWYGLYGSMMNGGYANGNKVGAQFTTSFSLIPHSKQYLEISAFQNDSSLLNDPMLSKYGTYGYAIPSSLKGIIAENEAGNTSAPSSFSILGISDAELLDSQQLSYSLYYRKQDINKKNYTFLTPETTVAGSISYSKKYESATLVAFANIAIVNNAYGLEGLAEGYYTGSVYVDIDSFIIVYAYNIYTLNGSSNFSGTNKDIASQSLSQSQVSFGYRFNKSYKADIAYRQLNDAKTGKSGQGVGFGIKYNIGTKY